MDNVAQSGPPAESGGNREFEAIITAYESALLRYVTRIVIDAAAARDVVQETFIKLYGISRNGGRPTENLRPWLYRVAHNGAVDHVRRERRLRRLHEREASERAAPGPAAPANPDDPPERVQILMEHMRCLDPAEQQVLLLRIQESLSYREISLVTGRTEGNVGCILCNAVRKIGASLKKAGLVRTGGLP